MSHAEQIEKLPDHDPRALISFARIAEHRDDDDTARVLLAAAGEIERLRAITLNVEHMARNEGFLELLAEALERKSSRIQGFLYADHHVIRDVSKPWAEQEIWRRRQKDESEYEACHAAMMRQIGIENLRLAVKGALEMAARPWPGQEKAAEAAKLALLTQEEGRC